MPKPRGPNSCAPRAACPRSSHLRQFPYTKFIVAVDDDLDVHSRPDAIWALTTRMDPARDKLLIERTPIDLDFAPPRGGPGQQDGRDATNKWPGETQREWARPMAMDAEVSARMHALVDALGL